MLLGGVDALGWCSWCKTVAVGSVDTNWAVTVVLGELEVGVVGPGEASGARAGGDEAWADIDGVGVTWGHLDGREVWEGTLLRLVVVAGGGVGAGAWVVALPEEGSWSVEDVGLQGGVHLVGEDEFERAVGVGAVEGDVEGEDGAEVVGGEDTVVLRAEGEVGVFGGDMRDVGWRLELTSLEGTRAAGAGVEVLLGQGAFLDDAGLVDGGCQAHGHGENGEGLHCDGVVTKNRVY